jgi:hypothetical protein
VPGADDVGRDLPRPLLDTRRGHARVAGRQRRPVPHGRPRRRHGERVRQPTGIRGLAELPVSSGEGVDDTVIRHALCVHRQGWLDRERLHAVRIRRDDGPRERVHRDLRHRRLRRDRRSPLHARALRPTETTCPREIHAPRRRPRTCTGATSTPRAHHHLVGHRPRGCVRRELDGERRRQMLTPVSCAACASPRIVGRERHVKLRVAHPVRGRVGVALPAPLEVRLGAVVRAHHRATRRRAPSSGRRAPSSRSGSSRSGSRRCRCRTWRHRSAPRRRRWARRSAIRRRLEVGALIAGPEDVGERRRAERAGAHEREPLDAVGRDRLVERLALRLLPEQRVRAWRSSPLPPVSVASVGSHSPKSPIQPSAPSAIAASSCRPPTRRRPAG